MPIYEYECEKCGNPVDLLQKIGDPAPPKCEKCGAKGKMKRRVSKTSFVLKGGGWGADLYGNKKAASSDKTSASPATTTSTSAPPAAATTTSTTPAAAAPAKPAKDKK